MPSDLKMVDQKWPPTETKETSCVTWFIKYLFGSHFQQEMAALTTTQQICNRIEQ